MDIRKFFGKKPDAGAGGAGGAGGAAADKTKAKEEADKKKASITIKGADKKVAASPAAKTASKKSAPTTAGTKAAPSEAKNRKRPSAAEDDDDEVEVVVKPKKRVVEPEADKKKGGAKEESASPMEVDTEEDGGNGKDLAKPEESACKKRGSAPRGAKEKGGAAGKKRRKVSKKFKDSDESELDDEESEEEEEDDESEFEDMDASSEEDEEVESDDDFGSQKKGKGKKGKAAVSKKKPTPVKKRKQIVVVDEDDDEEVVIVSSSPSNGKGKTTASSAQKVKVEERGRKKAESPKRTEISATEFFGSGTRSKFFSQGSPSPAKDAKPADEQVGATSAASPAPAIAVKPDEENKKSAQAAEPAVEAKPVKEEVAAKATKEESAKSPKKPGFNAYRGGAHTGGAMAPGSKQIPTGAPNCLDGKTFVFTGLMEALSREAADDLVKMYGGRVTSAVSGKTSYVVVGLKLEDGRPIEDGKKYKDAVAKKVKILDEDAFLALIRDSPGKSAEDVLSGMSPKASKAKAPSSTAKGKAAASTVDPSTAAAASAGKGRMAVATATATLKAEQAKHEDNPCELWADKYRPKVAEDLIGSADLVRNITRWLSQWDMVHRKKTMKIPYSKENPGAKAVLLSGPPGIGKSTVAGVVARAQGYDILELNASDTRSKKTLKEELGDVLDNSVLFMKHDKKGDHATAQNKRVVIMDEVDGMSGSDRGGMQELIRLIKTSKVPIICICNDRQSTKVRGLANNCYDLRVRRPLKQQISQRMMGIAAKEGLQIDRNAIEMLIESVGNDIRQVLNSMQMWKKTSSKMSYMDMKDRLSSIEKDKSLRLSAFDAGKMIVGDGANTPFMDRYNAFFIDYSLVPLLVEQNYIDSIKHSKESLSEKLQRLDAAAEAVSDSDLVGKLIMGDGNWGLLPLQACMNVKVGYHTRGIIPFPTFPQWFGKNSTQGKKRRLTQELLMHMTGRVSGGFEAVRMHYVPALRERIVSYLERGAEGVPDVIELLDEYGMSRDDVMETLTELFLSPNGKDPLKELDSKVKAAFTREYNKTVHMSQGLAHSEAFKVGKGKKGGGGGGAAGGALDEDGTPLEAEGAEEDNNVEEEEEEDEDVSKFIKKKKASAKASKDGEGKGKGKASSGKAKAGGKKK